MKKHNIYRLTLAVGLFLIIGFILRTAADILTYDPINNSAPLCLFVILRALEFLLPSAAAFIASAILKKKFSE